MGLKRVFYYKSVLLTTALLIMAGVVILYFPETYYLKETGWNLTAEKEIPGVKGDYPV